MDISQQRGLLITGCFFAVFAVALWVGVFVPRFRWRWGKTGQGAQMSWLSQVICSALITFPAIGAFALACHQSWPERIALPVVLPLFVAMFVMNCFDNIQRKA
jgi:hypothetical protein